MKQLLFTLSCLFLFSGCVVHERDYHDGYYHHHYHHHDHVDVEAGVIVD